MKKIIYIMVFSFFCGCLAQAESKCVQGSSEKNQLNEQLKMAKGMRPTTRSICEKYGLLKETEAGSSDFCLACEQNLTATAQNTHVLKSLAAPSKSLLFKPECLFFAGSVHASAQEMSCPGGKKGKFNLCISTDLLNYENAVVSEFLSCVKKLKPDFPLTGEGLYELYSLESGFKPNYVSGAGTGMGQLTGIFVQDALLKGRGRDVMNLVANSTEKECTNAKQIAEKDLSEIKDSASFLKKNPCAFTQVGEGIERNILYSMVEMANNWERDIAPSMKKFSDRWMRDPRFSSDSQFKEDFSRAQQLALINSYGHGGLTAARATVRSLSKLAPKEFVRRIQKPLVAYEEGESFTDYITTMQARQKQIGSKMSEPLRSEFKKSGAKSCVQ